MAQLVSVAEIDDGRLNDPASAIMAQSAQHIFTKAMQQHQAGRLHDAERLYKQILEKEPRHVGALHYLGVVAHQQGRSELAVNLIRRAISLNPQSPEAHNNLGLALKEAGQTDDAIASYRRALAQRPAYASAFYNLGVALASQRQTEDAIAALRQAIALRPDYVEAYNNLGIALRDSGQGSESIAAYRQAIALRPDYAEAFNNLAGALKSIGQIDEAIAAYRQAVKFNPDLAEAHHNLAATLAEQGQLEDAIPAFRRAVALRPDYAEAIDHLALALRRTGRFDEAIAAYRQSVALNPASADAHNSLGIALKSNGQADEALAAFDQAAKLNPEFAEAHNNLGTVLKERGELDAAVAAFRRALAIRPDFPQALNNLGNALKDLGDLDEAIASYQRAVDLAPDQPGPLSNLAYMMHFHPAYDRRDIAEQLRTWNQRHAQPLERFIQPFTNLPDPDRRLRIGYVSADFCAHSSAHFLVPLFNHHNPEQVEIYCYAEVARPDAMTRLFQQKVHHWRSTVGLTDEQMAQQIREDHIDLLVDLKLHTTDNRLLVFARKPAPVQATWLGCPTTTGLTTIDYRLTDPYLDPPGTDESVYSEKTFRLPDTFWCYDPLDGREIPVNPLPALASGAITFGSLNNFAKFNEATFILWSQLLHELENSRLLLLAGPGSHRQWTWEIFARQGIARDRIEFIPRQMRLDYLRTYNRIDIGLDSFPCNGHTTSLDSFWMGVPIITLIGKTLFARAGWTELSNLNLSELAAHTPRQFVQIALSLAKDLPRLEQLRATLRQRMELSPLMDAPKFARNMEAAYRQMWRTWCESAGVNNAGPESSG